MNQNPIPPAPSTGPTPPHVVVVKQKSKAGKILLGLLLAGFVLVGGCTALLMGAVVTVDEALETADIETKDREQVVIDATTLTECGVSDFGYGVVVEFTSPFDEEKGYISIAINFLDGDGVVIDSGNIVFTDIEAGQTARETLETFTSDAEATGLTCVVADSAVL